MESDDDFEEGNQEVLAAKDACDYRHNVVVSAPALSPRKRIGISNYCASYSKSRSRSPSLSTSVYSSHHGSHTDLTVVSTSDPNWQAKKTSIRERNSAMFNNEFMSDVTFIVGSKKIRIPAHKYILATGSCVFYSMFFGGLASTTGEIEIPDVDPAAFFGLLRYLYTDVIEVEADNVLSTLYTAKKYIVPHLAMECVRYLENSLTARNACVLLSQSRLFEEADLTQRCWQVIDAQAEEALKSEGFADIDFSTLEAILKRDTLNAKEVSIFQASARWAEAECARRGLPANRENKRVVLGDALYLIRMVSMAIEDFANNAAQSDVLTLQSSAYRSNQWRYRGRCDSIQFSVDRRIFIAGYGLYGSSNGAAEYKVRQELKRSGGQVLGHVVTSVYTDGSSNPVHVTFSTPIQVEPDCFYTASVVLDGPELSYFGQEGVSEVQVGSVTFQFQCSSDSTNGTGVQGGQIPELVFYS